MPTIKAETINGVPMVLYWQKMPYELKRAHAVNLVRDFYNHPDVAGNVCVSVGGLDSITLAVFVRSIYPDVRLVSVSGVENPTNQRVHRALGVENVPRGRDKNGEPWTLPKVYRECGYPIFSKDKAKAIHGYWKGLTSSYIDDFIAVNDRTVVEASGREGKIGRKKGLTMPKKQWAIVKRGKPDFFNVSHKCCALMKEEPLNRWIKNEGLYPYLGLMESEGGTRSAALRGNGCNYISEKTKRSCPFASFLRDDILRLALEMNDYYKEHWREFNPDPDARVDSIIPAAYGNIETYYSESGEMHYRTTKADRTGCTCCGFGLSYRPNSFDVLREQNPKAWVTATKPISEGGWGWGDVFDYFDIDWRTPYKPKPKQETMFDDIYKSISEKE